MKTKKKTATITFHASHNYGSMLQAYALQQTLLSLGVDNEIINFRTASQRLMYPHPVNDKKTIKQSIKNILLRTVIHSYDRHMLAKYELFENFLKDYLILTQEYNVASDLVQLSDNYDYYLTGSDQCWNTKCVDFDWSYYLQYTDSQNKISYASSLGPVEVERNWTKIVHNLSTYKAISVREEGTADEIKKHIDKDISVLPDPTLLVSALKWKEIIPKQRIVDQPYIFLYTPYPRRGFLKLATHVSHCLGLPIVISNITDLKGDFWTALHRNATFQHILNIGPREFLNLILNAELVLGGSFHSLIFSILLHRPFYAYEGLKDNRMKQLLNIYGLNDRAINLHDMNIKLDRPYDIEFNSIDKVISQQKFDAINFLRRVLDME